MKTMMKKTVTATLLATMAVLMILISIAAASRWSPRKPSATHYSVRLFTPSRALHTFVNRAKQWYSAIYEDSVYDLLLKIYYFDNPSSVQRNSSTFIVLADGVGCFKTSALNFTVLDLLWMMDSFTPQYKGLQVAPESGKQCDTFADDVELLHYFVVNGTSNATSSSFTRKSTTMDQPRTIVSERVQEELFLLNKQNNGQVDLNPLIQHALKFSLAQLKFHKTMKAKREEDRADNDRIPVEVMIPMLNGNDETFSALFEDYKIGERSLPTHAFEVPVPEENCVDLGEYQLRTIKSLLLV